MIKVLEAYEDAVINAAEKYEPSIVARYVISLATAFNKFYHDCSILQAGEKEKKETLSMLLAALKNKAIDKREDLTPEEETQVILKEIKQTKETLDMTPADRTEIIEECNKRLAVLEQYAPKMMDEAEIKEVVASVLAEMGLDAPTAKDKGKIMKNLMPKVKGKADGKLVNEIVSTFMK